MDLPPHTKYFKRSWDAADYTYLGISPIDPELVDFLVRNFIPRNVAISYHIPVPYGLQGFAYTKEEFDEIPSGMEMIMCAHGIPRSEVIQAIRDMPVKGKEVIHDF